MESNPAYEDVDTTHTARVYSRARGNRYQSDKVVSKPNEGAGTPRLEGQPSHPKCGINSKRVGIILAGLAITALLVLLVILIGLIRSLKLEVESQREKRNYY